MFLGVYSSKKTKQRSRVLSVVQVYEGHMFGVWWAENAEKGLTKRNCSNTHERSGARGYTRDMAWKWKCLESGVL